MSGKQRLVKRTIVSDTIVVVEETKSKKVVSYELNNEIKPAKKTRTKKKPNV